MAKKKSGKIMGDTGGPKGHVHGGSHRGGTHEIKSQVGVKTNKAGGGNKKSKKY